MSCVETHLWGAVREMDLNRKETERCTCSNARKEIEDMQSSTGKNTQTP